MSDNESVHSQAMAGKECQITIFGNKSKSLNSSPPEGDAVFDMDDQEEEDEEEESDALDTTEPRDSGPSPAEACDESAPKRCVYKGCSETSALGAKQRKPWMCKKHRNKMYKDKYKKKKNDQALASGKLEEGSEERPVSVTKQRLGAIGERPTRPSLIEQVLNQKRLKLRGKAQKKMMTIELKREIIGKHEQGVRVIDLARQYGRSTSMICTMLKQKELIKSITPAKGVTIISKRRTSLHENMEKLLMVWVKEKQRQGDTLTRSIICKKARGIYGDLLKQTPRTSTDEASEDSFKASRGWFDNFRKRTGIHSGVRHVEAASSDVKAAEDYLEMFSELIGAEGYIPQQVFRDMNEFVEEHSQELTTEELQELQSQQHTEVLQEIGFKEEPEVEEVISTSEIKEMLGMWERVSQFVEKKHPEKVATGRASELFNDTCLTYFRNILEGRKTQTSVDSYFLELPAGESEESVAKKAKTSEEKTVTKIQRE